MSQTDVSLPQTRKFGQTSRSDGWRRQPVLTFLGLSAFIVYSTWAALQASNYFYNIGGADYLSPFYSPVLWDAEGPPSGHAWIGPMPSWWPSWLIFSPAFLILWAPGGFRFTCYYYRGAYYKAFWADPPNCAVGEPRKGYRGENSLPLIFQNIHRMFMYVAVVFIFILTYDAWRGMWFLKDVADPEAGRQFGMGVGTLVLMLNVVLLGGYTLGCHSLRHLIGGRFNILSKNKARKKAYDCVSCLNRRHMLLAWMSLFWVGFTDVYIRLCASGVWSDWRIF